MISGGSGEGHPTSAPASPVTKLFSFEHKDRLFRSESLEASSCREAGETTADDDEVHAIGSPAFVLAEVDPPRWFAPETGSVAHEAFRCGVTGFVLMPVVESAVL